MLNSCKTLLRVLCLWPTTVPPSTSLFRYSVNLSIELVTFIGSFLYVLQNSDDIEEATDSGFVCFAFSTTTFIYIWLISKRYRIECSMSQLESYVIESKRSSTEKIKQCSILLVCLFANTSKGTTRVAGSHQHDEDILNSNLYEEAENRYTKRARRYIYSWFGIVCFYGIVILIIPANDMIHGQMNASNWTTLFRKVYMKFHTFRFR